MTSNEMDDPSSKSKGIHSEHVDRVSSGESGLANGGLQEKGGIGSGVDDEPEKNFSLRMLLPLSAMAFLWTGSQIPLYLFGGIPPLIYADIGGVDRWIWFVLGNLLALAAICPFVGSLSDLFGRRYVAIIGACFLILGMIVSSTAHTMNIFICGMTLAGVGAGINELTALAVTSEIAPTKKRGIYVSLMVLTIVPYCPSQLWGQLVASASSWRYVGLWCGVWAFIGLVLTVLFYHPPARQNSSGLSRREILRRIDYIGGLLSISGMVLFMMGLQFGSYQYTWTSTHCLVPFFLGVFLIACFFVWELYFAKFPMFPRNIISAEPRILSLTLIITCISGAQFFSVLLFWPTQSYNVYGHDPTQVGVRSLPLGFGILAGAVIVLALLSWTKGHIRELMLVSCVFMTAGGGALAALTLENVKVVYPLLLICGLGIGGIVVPASIITTIICPEEVIATVTALTLAIRVIGGALGYCIYYSIFANKFKTNLTVYVVPTTLAVIDKSIGKAAIEETVTQAADLTVAGILPAIRQLPGITSDQAYEKIVLAGQQAYAHSYPYVYWVSLSFGILSIICSLFLTNIKKYMNNHIAAAYA